MRGVLLRNLHFYTRNFNSYTRNLHLRVRNLKPASFIANGSTNSSCKNHAIRNAQLLNSFPSRIRFLSTENGNPDPDSKPEPESSVAAPEEKEAAGAEIEDVDNKVLKSQLDDYFQKLNEEALPDVMKSILLRRLSGKYEEIDEELLDELKIKPLDNVKDEDFESDFEDMHETDDEIEDLYDARDVTIKRMASDPYFNMDDTKWDEMIKEATDRGYLKDTRECEQILEDMLKWDNLLPDEIKKKVEVKFNEIGDRVERGELTVEEGYELFKEFEDEMVLEAGKLMEAEGSRSDFDNVMTGNDMNYDDPPGEGPVLRWETRVVLCPGGDSWHPKNRKVKLSVTVKELGLSKHQFLRLRALAGKRYNPGKDELTIVSERFEHREENRKDCLRTLFSLIEDAEYAQTLVDEARVSDVKERLKANPKFMQRLLSKRQAAAQAAT